MSTAVATSLLRPITLRHVSRPSPSSRSYVIIPRAVAKQNKKASVSVSSKEGGSRFAASKATVADGNLRDIIESEIEALQSQFSKKDLDLPNSPFEVIDNQGEEVIVLKRELNGETIKATVFPVFDGEPDEDFDDFEDEDDEEDDGEGDDVAELEQEEEMGKPGLEVTVTVEKGEGPFLEFACSFSESGFLIDGVSLKNNGGVDNENTYVGPNFADLDEGLQDALQRYLEVRGIRNPMFNALMEYMMNKEGKEFMLWLKNIKRFVSSK